MKIGMVTACYKPVINGVTRMVELYKRHLEERGHQVTIFTLGEPDPAGDEPGVVRSPAIPMGNSGYYFSFSYNRQAQKLLGEMEIVHCHHLIMSMEMAHRYVCCPIVYTNHTRYDLYTGAYVPLPQPAADALMAQVWPELTDMADVVITPSQSVKQVMLEFGVRQPIVVIENGVDLRPFLTPTHPLTKQQLGVPDSAVLLAYAGRLSSEKNLTILLEQFAIAKEVVSDLHLMLIGKGPLQLELEQQAQDLALTDNIHFIGAVPYESMANYLAAADLFVTASVTEVHPLTIIEAMATGLPVAATTSPGIVDTVDSGKTGLLVSDPERGLAAAIVGLALNPALRQQMSQAARQACHRFDINCTVEKTLELYSQLCLDRPDLHRENPHGRSLRNREKWEPVVEQLARLLRPPEKLGTGPLKWLSTELFGERDAHE